MPSIDLAYADRRLKLAGFQFDGLAVVPAPGPNTLTHPDLPAGAFLRVDGPAGPLSAFDAFLRGASLLARRARKINDIIQDVLALSAAQRGRVRADLVAGTPPRWRATGGPLVWSQAAAFTAAAGEVQALALAVAVTFYCLDFPDYLARPAFDPTINVPGDEPAP